MVKIKTMINKRLQAGENIKKGQGEFIEPNKNQRNKEEVIDKKQKRKIEVLGNPREAGHRGSRPSSATLLHRPTQSTHPETQRADQTHETFHALVDILNSNKFIGN